MALQVLFGLYDEVFVTGHRNVVGGMKGQIFRRLFHLTIVFYPILYYCCGDDISGVFGLTRDQLIALIFPTIVVLEYLRVRYKIIYFGVRSYEKNQFSASAWGAMGIVLVLLIVPSANTEGLSSGIYGLPIVFALSFIDPIMGTARREFKLKKSAVISIGVLVSYIVWFGAFFLLDTPLIVAFLIAPLGVVGELIKLKGVDDNATILLIPTAGLLLLLPFI